MEMTSSIYAKGSALVYGSAGSGDQIKNGGWWVVGGGWQMAPFPQSTVSSEFQFMCYRRKGEEMNMTH